MIENEKNRVENEEKRIENEKKRVENEKLIKMRIKRDENEKTALKMRKKTR